MVQLSGISPKTKIKKYFLSFKKEKFVHYDLFIISCPLSTIQFTKCFNPICPGVFLSNLATGDMQNPLPRS